MMRQAIALSVSLLASIVTSGCSKEPATTTPAKAVGSTSAAAPPKGRVSGRVLRDGKPVAGARVTAWLASRHVVEGGETTTDEAGQFTLVSLPLDAELQLVITKTLPGSWVIDHKGLTVRLSATRPSLKVGDVDVGAMPPPLNWPGPEATSTKAAD